MNLLWEKGVVKVHPAILFFSAAVLLTIGKREFKLSADKGNTEQFITKFGSNKFLQVFSSASSVQLFGSALKL